MLKAVKYARTLLYRALGLLSVGVRKLASIQVFARVLFKNNFIINLKSCTLSIPTSL
jgi:hypothetical protein